MLARRIIPCLDVKGGRVVKGVQFVGLRDAGDPVECAARYDAEGADELTFLDIAASSDARRILLEVVERTAAVIAVPLTVGGGVRERADVRSLLAAGATVETLETAGFWSNLPRLYDAVRLSLHTSLGSPLVMCHISHVYGTGASLYFTVVTAQGDDPVGQWEEAKRSVNEAIVAAGGTVSHHHGVGRDHREAYATEIGDLGVEILRGIKGRLDPEGILNPGVLVPPGG